MADDISRLMDGELDDDSFNAVYDKLKRGDGLDAWVCYHVIGDALRGSTDMPAAGFSSRLASRLHAEPTVLAPQSKQERPLAAYAWAAAAGVAAVSLVGWVAFGTLDSERAIAKAGEATTVRAAQIRRQTLPPDYLLAHQEYSPTTQIQGVGPYLRAVSAVASDARP